MLDGVMLLWWILTIPSFLFVVIDIWRTTPESVVLKWAFVILTAFTGPLGAFFYVLGCREPLRGNHEQYVAIRWRQVLGSTMHCVAGDGIGIVVGAAIGGVLTMSFWPDFLLEYLLGFGFGWAFFQAFAMRDAAGGSYVKSLKMTFLPELLSMNLLMTGMIITSRFAMRSTGGGDDPMRPELVHHVDGADCRFRVCVPDQLVACRQPHEARDDDGSCGACNGSTLDGCDVGRIVSGLGPTSAQHGSEGRDDIVHFRRPWRRARHRRPIRYVSYRAAHQGDGWPARILATSERAKRTRSVSAPRAAASSSARA
ncbi:MAG: DUF4396 domain-containing protein [Mycobacterium sp.]|uniref:DUF4396 domain-containing protein n=1 Tax=Mycobacterium sp. TaxID=1785 RepID=UPI003BB6D7A1